MNRRRDDYTDSKPKDATGTLVCLGGQSAAPFFVCIKMDDGITALSTDNSLSSTIEAIRRESNWAGNTITVKFEYITVEGIRMIHSVQSLHCMGDVGYVTINRADPTAASAPGIVGQVSNDPPKAGNILCNSLKKPYVESPTSLEDGNEESSSDGAFSTKMDSGIDTMLSTSTSTLQSRKTFPGLKYQKERQVPSKQCLSNTESALTSSTSARRGFPTVAKKMPSSSTLSNIESALTSSTSVTRGFPTLARKLPLSSTFQVTSEQSVSGESVNDQTLPPTSNWLPLNAPFGRSGRDDPRSEHVPNGSPGNTLISFPKSNGKAGGNAFPKIDSRSCRGLILEDNFSRSLQRLSPNPTNLINGATFPQMAAGGRPLNAAISPFQSSLPDFGRSSSHSFGVSSSDTRNPEGGPTLPTFMPDGLSSLSLHSLPNGVSADIPVTTETVNPRSRVAKPKFRNMTQNLDECDDALLHDILNEWYYEPFMLYKPTYPFVVSGFIDKRNYTDSRFTFFSRRTGSLMIQDSEERKRKNAIFGYCMVMGPGNCRAWEFDMPPPSFKSTKFLKNGGIDVKGYGILAATSEKSERDWFVWNDQLGLMPCLTSAGRSIKQKYKEWTPTLQAVMFDAVDEGQWKVKQLSHVSYDTMEKNGWFPQQMYFVNDAVKMPTVNGAPMKFYSERLRAEISIKRRENVIDENHDGKFEVFFIFDWHTALDGQFFALAVYPPKYRYADENSIFQKLVSHVHIVENWETDHVLCSLLENNERSILSASP